MCERARSFQPEADPPLAEVGTESLDVMFYVYVLLSQRNGKRYVGYTGKAPKIRLAEHNAGASQFTNQNRPFVLVYSERFSDKSEAIRREKFLKSGQGRRYLDSVVHLGP